MKLVALDYGGVVGDHHISQAEERLAALFGVKVSTLNGLLSERGKLGDSVRRGDISLDIFWEKVAHGCGLSHPPGRIQTLSRMWAETYRINQVFVEGMSRLRDEALIGIVTNIDQGRANYLKDSVNILKFVDLLWTSCEIRRTKSERELWRCVVNDVRALGVTEMLYIDDRVEHLRAAEAAGFEGLLHTGDPQKTVKEMSRWVFKQTNSHSER